MESDKHIYYKSGYKYQLSKDAMFATSIIGYTYDTDFIKITPIGIVTGRKGYAWDGASGVRDTKTILRASLLHDILFQLMRQEVIPKDGYFDYANDLFKQMCLDDGVVEFRANYLYLGLDVLDAAENAADPKNKKVIHVAP